MAHPMQPLRAKLRPPLSATPLVPRASLVARLVSDTQAFRVTAVIAPAGFGKTSLVLEALRQAPGAVAWVTLDPRDNALPAFVPYVVLALQQHAPAVGADGWPRYRPVRPRTSRSWRTCSWTV